MNSRRLKKRSDRKNGDRKSTLNYSFFSGLFLGIFISFVIFIWQDEISSSLKKVNELSKNELHFSQSSKKISGQSTAQKSPTFYKFLSTEKVPVPKSDSVDRKSLDISKVSPDQFYLQIGSFKNLQDADSRKARLALLGIYTKIEETTHREGDSWYRVKLGPISRNQARDIRKKMYNEGFEVLVTRE